MTYQEVIDKLIEAITGKKPERKKPQLAKVYDFKKYKRQIEARKGQKNE
jgi:hypothetical protein